MVSIGEFINDFWGILSFHWGDSSAFSPLHTGDEGMDIMSIWAPDLQLPSINTQERHWKPMVVPESPGKSHGPNTIGSSVFP